MKKACVWTAALLLALLFGSTADAWDYKKFPDLEGLTPAHKAYVEEMNVVWELFDIDGDAKPDAGLGRVPKSVTPMLTMTPFGPRMMCHADTEDVAITHYWMDLNGDGCPCGKDGEDLDYSEFLHDPAADGLNGNEKAMFKVGKGAV